MTKGEFLRQLAELHRRWAIAHADRVKLNQGHRHPHRGGKSDYNEHHADRSAPANIEDRLNRKILRLIKEFRRSIG